MAWQYKGVFPALQCPFNPDLSIDEQEMRKFAAWLAGIIVNLLLVGNYFDIALRDFGLCLGALALWRLALAFDHPNGAISA